MLAWARVRGLRWPRAVEWGAAFLIGGLLLVGGNGGVSWAEQRVASGPAALVVALMPLWVVLLEARGGAGRPGPAMLIGLALGVLGLVLLVGPDQLIGRGRLDPLGAGVLVLASLSWATGTVRLRRVPLPASGVLSTGSQMLAGGALLLAIAGATGELAHFEPRQVTARSAIALAYLVVFGSIVAFSAYVWLLRVAPATQVSTYAWVNPIVAVLLGWALGGEPLTVRTVLASIVIVGGVVVVNTAGRARAPASVGRSRTEPSRKASARC